MSTDAHNPLPSSAGVGAGLYTLHGPRSLAELHRDVWTVLRRHPVVFVALPVLAWLPFDFVLDLLVTNLGGDLQALNVTNKIERLFQFTLGTALLTTAVAASMRLGQGQDIGPGEAFSAGVKAWVKTVGPLLIAGIMTGLGFLLLLVPGFILLARYSLVIPVVLYEGQSSSAALSRSTELVKRLGTGKVLAYGFTTYVCYLGLTQLGFMAYGWFFPDTLGLGPAESVLNALLTAPANVLPIGLALGTVMLYHDAITLEKQDQAPAALHPFGLSLRAYGKTVDAPTSTSLLPLAAALLTGAAALTLWVVFLLIGLGVLDPSVL